VGYDSTIEQMNQNQTDDKGINADAYPHNHATVCTENLPKLNSQQQYGE